MVALEVSIPSKEASEDAWRQALFLAKAIYKTIASDTLIPSPEWMAGKEKKVILFPGFLVPMIIARRSGNNQKDHPFEEVFPSRGENIVRWLYKGPYYGWSTEWWGWPLEDWSKR